MTDDPTGLATRRANVRGTAQGHGAATDRYAVRALVRATERRRAASATTAVVVTREPRGYTTADHERAEALREEAASIRKIADQRTGEARAFALMDARNLEDDAEQIVPLVHARAGWR